MHNPDASFSPPTCWVVTDGKTGTENQCLGLAQSLGIVPTVKRIILRWPWRIFSPFIKGFERFAFSVKGDQIAAPYPDLVIASGRRSLPAVFAIKKANPSTVVVQLQDPHCDHKWFDLIVAPAHDRMTGPKVMTLLGALNKVTLPQLEAAAAAQAPRFAHLPAPYTALLLGGSNAIYDFDAAQMTTLVDQLEALLATTDGSLLITPSRRTGDENLKILQDRLGRHPRVWIWDWDGENPYFALLGLATHILVTADSVSMISEAAATGKPIHVIALKGGSKKFDHFHAGFRAAGITRPFTGDLENWHYPPLHESKAVAERVRHILSEKNK